MLRFYINNKKRFVFFLVSVFIFLTLTLSAILYVNYQINVPLNSWGQEKIFVVEKGEGLKEVAVNLEKENLIRQKFWFMTYIFYRGWAGQLKAGEFILNPSLSVSEIAQKITDKALSQEVEITIPEGFTLKKIDARLTAAGLIKEGEFLADSRKLEGYLFPDTYRFEKGDSLDEIIKKMTDNFDQKVDKSLRDEITRQKKTLEEIIVMASI